MNATGTVPDGVRTTVSTAAFASAGGSGGVQRGSLGANPAGTIVLLTTGVTDNTSADAIDLFLDFTGVNAGTVSFDWASVNNSTGDRKGSLRVYTSTDGTTFTELAAAAVLNFTNNVLTTGSITSVSLPASFNNSATARIRFYEYNATGGTTGSRPKISIDNVRVSVAQAAIKFRSAASGNWNANTTWEMSADGTNWSPATQTPTSANDTITVRSPHTVTVTANIDADQMTIDSGGTVSVNNGITFTITEGTGTDLTDNGTVATAGNITNNGQAVINNTLQINEGGFPGVGSGTYSYDQSTGKLVFNNSTGPYGVNNNNYWPTSNGPQNVTVQNTGGIQMNVARTVGGLFQTAKGVQGTALTFNGTGQINPGGFFLMIPNWGNASLLRYNTGGAYGRASEWFPGATSGAGYPANVQLSNNTTLDLPNSSATSPFKMGGNLTVDLGSQMLMAGGTPMNQPLTVVGSVTNGSTATKASICLFTSAGVICGNGISIHFTLLESPPLASIQ